MISDDLKERALPEVLAFNNGRTVDSPDLWHKRRVEVIELLGREIYGFSPPPP